MQALSSLALLCCLLAVVGAYKGTECHPPHVGELISAQMQAGAVQAGKQQGHAVTRSLCLLHAAAVLSLGVAAPPQG